MKVRCFLILGQNQANGKVTVRRAVSRYPSLDWNEAVVSLELEVPDDVFEAPLFTVEVAKRQIEVAVEPQDVEQ